ncbi:phosphonate C-P lyase system protein PhnG [Maritimibacter alkaliphilus]|uniref:phosphonate C-P lyase system protein PhnG n=1 Tax=Maritimibacter alkaliphilus TaxID=404236 RepID=UPI001C94D2DB|nr:phosphonate C-P lyase system protein PhnG [Maritimibacter alkaliphilus]MBY6089555.1 phosphonate C-P lyase system protein PhnG [Maritimibacter alkaliphilus]
MSPSPVPETPDTAAGTAARRDWMSVLAKAPAADLDALWQAHGATPVFTWLRAPEVGAVMVRGRAGAVGAAFNLGEMSVTRASLRLADGTVGHAYVQGRSRRKAEQAALVDALMQTGAADSIGTAILAPLKGAASDRAEGRAARAAATKVEFFTMVRGENK